VGGEIPSAGISNVLVVDGSARVGAAFTNLAARITNSPMDVNVPSNLGGMAGSLIDKASETPNNGFSTSLGLANDFATAAIGGGVLAPTASTTLNMVNNLNLGTAFNAFKEAAMLVNTVYDIYKLSNSLKTK
jgi:hypothetical protein